jgi:hypothetical protein
MQNSKLDIISNFEFEKRSKIFVAVLLSSVFFVILGVLVKVDMSAELQQTLVVILGLFTIATLDAFRKALENTSSSLMDQFNQIIIQGGGVYVNNGSYQVNNVNNVNNESEKKQSLVEAATEIQQLLTQLEMSNPSATEAEKVAYVNDETSPSLKSRIASMVKGANLLDLETALDGNDTAKLIEAIMKGWLLSEKSTSENSTTTSLQRTDSSP